MDAPESILQKIMEFEQTYTPQFNNLIKQSLIANVDIDDDPENDIYPQLPDAPPPPAQRKSASDSAIAVINDHTHSIEALLSSSTSIPAHTMGRRAMHRHKETPIMSRAGINPNPIKMIDTNSFLITDDIEYHSQEEEEDENEDEMNANRYSSEEDEFEEDKPLHPLIEEYDTISHQIHVSKMKLRKLDRQMTMAARMSESQSEFVKKHSDIKIKIAQLISKRRELETHDIVREHLKDEQVDTVEIDVGGTEMMDINDTGLMEINEDEEEEDDEEEKEIINNATAGTMSPHTSDGIVSDDVSYINDDRSRTTSATMNDFDYSYDAEIVLKEDRDEDHNETGSVEIHSDEEDNGGGGSVKYHSTDEDEECSGGGGSVQVHSTEEEDDAYEEESGGGGSVQIHSSEEEEDGGGGSVQIHSSEEEDGGGSVQMHSTEEEEEEESGGGSVNIREDDDDDEEEGSMKIYCDNEYEDDDDDDGGGSVQLNEEIEQTETWVDEEFDTKELEIHDSDEEEATEHKRQTLDIKETHDTNENVNHNIPTSPNDNMDARSKRLEQMKRHHSYKEYAHHDREEDAHKDLDALKDKYRDSRRNREQISEIDTPFSMDDLLKVGREDDATTHESLEVFRENMSDEKEIFSEKLRRNEDPYHFFNDDEDDSEDSDDDEAIPRLPEKRKSVLLDIGQLSAKLADIVEEEWSSDEAEGRFHAVEYETDSDCDSNDSIVVKKEIVKNVTVSELEQFDSV